MRKKKRGLLAPFHLRSFMQLITVSTQNIIVSVLMNSSINTSFQYRRCKKCELQIIVAIVHLPNIMYIDCIADDRTCILNRALRYRNWIRKNSAYKDLKKNIRHAKKKSLCFHRPSFFVNHLIKSFNASDINHPAKKPLKTA